MSAYPGGLFEMNAIERQFHHLATIDLAIIAVYFATIVGLGLYLRRRAARGIDSYFLGERKIPWWVLGMSGTASNFDMTGTMVVISFVYALGMQGVWVSMRGGMVLPLGLLLVFMGRWLRRSQVMTNAEWMALRFGHGRDGHLARVLSAISNLVVTVAFLTYFVKGTGKFLAVFVDLPVTTCSTIMMAIALTYTVLSGLHGVVWTDVIQEVLLVAVSLYVGYVAITLPDHAAIIAGAGPEWTSLAPQWTAAPMEWLADPHVYHMFGLCIVFWVAKGVFEGAGGFTGGYMTQRYFAARSDRDASRMSAQWIVLLCFRWVLVVGVALIALSLAASSNQLGSILAADPERTLPEVIKAAIPPGVRGALIAGLIAAAMSTFDSTINAGASYWVRDIYQNYLKKDATEKQLLRQGYLSSLGLAVVGVALGLLVLNIDDIWGWITGPLAAGLFAPIILRWYWWRFNGYGFASSTAVGLGVAVLLKIAAPHVAFYIGFPLTWTASFGAGVVVSLLTAPNDPATLAHFYERIRPFGLWRPVASQLAPQVVAAAKEEHRRSYLAIPLAVGWHLSGVATVITLLLHRWHLAAASAALFATLATVLYFWWYRKEFREFKIAP